MNEALARLGESFRDSDGHLIDPSRVTSPCVLLTAANCVSGEPASIESLLKMMDELKRLPSRQKEIFIALESLRTKIRSTLVSDDQNPFLCPLFGIPIEFVGTESQAHELARQLRKDGWKVTLIEINELDTDAEYAADRIVFKFRMRY